MRDLSLCDALKWWMCISAIYEILAFCTFTFRYLHSIDQLYGWKSWNMKYKQVCDKNMNFVWLFHGTEIGLKGGTWFGEICSCCCFLARLGPAWVVLSVESAYLLADLCITVRIVPFPHTEESFSRNFYERRRRSSAAKKRCTHRGRQKSGPCGPHVSARNVLGYALTGSYSK